MSRIKANEVAKIYFIFDISQVTLTSSYVFTTTLSQWMANITRKNQNLFFTNVLTFSKYTYSLFHSKLQPFLRNIFLNWKKLLKLVLEFKIFKKTFKFLLSFHLKLFICFCCWIFFSQFFKFHFINWPFFSLSHLSISIISRLKRCCWSFLKK